MEKKLAVSFLMDMILENKIASIHRLNCRDRLSDRKNAGPRNSPLSMRRRSARVLSSTDVMSNTLVKPPTVEHCVQLLIKLLCIRVFYVKKRGRKNVDVTVRGNDESL